MVLYQRTQNRTIKIRELSKDTPAGSTERQSLLAGKAAT